jgi:histidine triad (HIT) family protein
MPTIFSRIVSGELPAYKIAEDADHLAFLDITPLVEGHTLVIPKKEIDYIFDMTPQALAALHVFAQRVAKGVQAAVPCRRIGVAVIGLEVPHAHIHLIPMNKVADMNFANPKITVPAERMQELAAAIAAQLPGGSGLPAPTASAAAEAAPAARKAAPSNANDATLAQLQKLTQGLDFGSESEAPLEAVSYAAPTGDLSDAQLLQVLGEPASAKVEKVELTLFLRTQTADTSQAGVAIANRYKALQVYMKQELDGTQVYRIGTGPQVHAYALGRDVAGRLAGFKTELTESERD